MTPNAAATLNETVISDEEQADVTAGDPTRDRDAWRDLVGRLNRQSTDKHFDAYADVAWDDPEMPDRPRRPALGARRRRPARQDRVVPVAAPEIRAEIGLMRSPPT